jgi:UDP:flavonoid glycosyltransferase YjiC (YdhE family)
MAAVVHHCRAGTTAATLRAGVPSVPVPVFADGAARLLAERVGAEDGAASVVQAVEATAGR